ncbi:MAG: hypothetical protein MJ252_03440 [archaeon]|nr:hypothetical protein [archaeon]
MSQHGNNSSNYFMESYNTSERRNPNAFRSDSLAYQVATGRPQPKKDKKKAVKRVIGYPNSSGSTGGQMNQRNSNAKPNEIAQTHMFFRPAEGVISPIQNISPAFNWNNQNPNDLQRNQENRGNFLPNNQPIQNQMVPQNANPRAPWEHSDISMQDPSVNLQQQPDNLSLNQTLINMMMGMDLSVNLTLMDPPLPAANFSRDPTLPQFSQNMNVSFLPLAAPHTSLDLRLDICSPFMQDYSELSYLDCLFGNSHEKYLGFQTYISNLPYGINQILNMQDLAQCDKDLNTCHNTFASSMTNANYSEIELDGLCSAFIKDDNLIHNYIYPQNNPVTYYSLSKKLLIEATNCNKPYIPTLQTLFVAFLTWTDIMKYFQTGSINFFQNGYLAYQNMGEYLNMFQEMSVNFLPCCFMSLKSADKDDNLYSLFYNVKQNKDAYFIGKELKNSTYFYDSLNTALCVLYEYSVPDMFIFDLDFLNGYYQRIFMESLKNQSQSNLLSKLNVVFTFLSEDDAAPFYQRLYGFNVFLYYYRFLKDFTKILSGNPNEKMLGGFEFVLFKLKKEEKEFIFKRGLRHTLYFCFYLYDSWRYSLMNQWIGAETNQLLINGIYLTFQEILERNEKKNESNIVIGITLIYIFKNILVQLIKNVSCMTPKLFSNIVFQYVILFKRVRDTFFGGMDISEFSILFCDIFHIKDNFIQFISSDKDCYFFFYSFQMTVANNIIGDAFSLTDFKTEDDICHYISLVCEKYLLIDDSYGQIYLLQCLSTTLENIPSFKRTAKVKLFSKKLALNISKDISKDTQCDNPLKCNEEIRALKNLGYLDEIPEDTILHLDYQDVISGPILIQHIISDLINITNEGGIWTDKELFLKYFLAQKIKIFFGQFDVDEDLITEKECQAYMEIGQGNQKEIQTINAFMNTYDCPDDHTQLEDSEDKQIRKFLMSLLNDDILTTIVRQERQMCTIILRIGLYTEEILYFVIKSALKENPEHFERNILPKLTPIFNNLMIFQKKDLFLMGVRAFNFYRSYADLYTYGDLKDKDESYKRCLFAEYYHKDNGKFSKNFKSDMSHYKKQKKQPEFRDSIELVKNVNTNKERLDKELIKYEGNGLLIDSIFLNMIHNLQKMGCNKTNIFLIEKFILDCMRKLNIKNFSDFNEQTRQLYYYSFISVKNNRNILEANTLKEDTLNQVFGVKPNDIEAMNFQYYRLLNFIIDNDFEPNVNDFTFDVKNSYYKDLYVSYGIFLNNVNILKNNQLVIRDMSSFQSFQTYFGKFLSNNLPNVYNNVFTYIPVFNEENDYFSKVIYGLLSQSSDQIYRGSFPNKFLGEQMEQKLKSKISYEFKNLLISFNRIFLCHSISERFLEMWNIRNSLKILKNNNDFTEIKEKDKYISKLMLRYSQGLLDLFSQNYYYFRGTEARKVFTSEDDSKLLNTLFKYFILYEEKLKTMVDYWTLDKNIKDLINIYKQKVRDDMKNPKIIYRCDKITLGEEDFKDKIYEKLSLDIIIQHQEEYDLYYYDYSGNSVSQRKNQYFTARNPSDFTRGNSLIAIPNQSVYYAEDLLKNLSLGLVTDENNFNYHLFLYCKLSLLILKTEKYQQNKHLFVKVMSPLLNYLLKIGMKLECELSKRFPHINHFEKNSFDNLVDILSQINAELFIDYVDFFPIIAFKVPKTMLFKFASEKMCQLIYNKIHSVAFKFCSLLITPFEETKLIRGSNGGRFDERLNVNERLRAFGFHVLSLLNSELGSKGEVIQKENKRENSQMVFIRNELSLYLDIQRMLDYMALVSYEKKKEQNFDFLKYIQRINRHLNNAFQSGIRIILPTEENMRKYSAGDQNVLYIKNMSESYKFLESKQRPMRISFTASNDNINETVNFTFLLKKDIQDAMKEILAVNLLNKVRIILSDKSLKEEEDLKLRTYNIVELSKSCILVEWLRGFSPIHDIIGDLLMKNDVIHEYKRDGNHYDSVIQRNSQVNMFKDITSFENVPEKFNVFYKYFYELSGSPENWWKYKLRFTKSFALWSAIGSLLGLGDRHLGNIMINRYGEMANIDFGCVVGQGRSLPVPEEVFFRFTKNFRSALDINDGSGIFLFSLRRIFCLFNKYFPCLKSEMENFYYHHNQVAFPADYMTDYLIKLDELFGDRENIMNRVVELISTNGDPKILAKMYIYWDPFV